MDFKESRRRENEIVEAWRERMAEKPPRYPCADCSQDYKFQQAGRTLETIAEGVSWAHTSWNWIPVCDAHYQARKENANVVGRE